MSVGELQRIAKPLAPDHALALALWKTGWHDARMLFAFLGEPERVTPAEMERLVCLARPSGASLRPARAGADPPRDTIPPRDDPR